MTACVVLAMGTPVFMGNLQAKAGEMLIGKTAVNAACAYGFLNYQNEPRKIIYHITRNGNIIFDYITVLKGAADHEQKTVL